MQGPLIPTFMLTLVALVLLHVPASDQALRKLIALSHRILVNFSVPFNSGLYFLSASVTGDTIRFGLWGFCMQQSGQCTPKTLGYHLDPEIIFWLTQVLVFFPIATIFTALLLFSILPAVFFHVRRDTIYPPPLYSLLAIPAALSSFLAFAFMIALFTVAKFRFQSVGFDASYGPLPWVSLVATIILLCLMFYTGCGVTWRGPLGELSPYIRNRWSGVYSY